MCRKGSMVRDPERKNSWIVSPFNPLLMFLIRRRFDRRSRHPDRRLQKRSIFRPFLTKSRDTSRIVLVPSLQPHRRKPL
ncbi:hypothetical protein L596_027441 [Steinernema carpocapsae]|uniref:Uncharacterized protein n=1 Tax=Steinernema carpocapsae TaxID=34508 RepID=A0A4U5M4M4_STECR|nr:hypothetical protein L596_027441 [Steinernema carpocapsae]